MERRREGGGNRKELKGGGGGTEAGKKRAPSSSPFRSKRAGGEERGQNPNRPSLIGIPISKDSKSLGFLPADSAEELHFCRRTAPSEMAGSVSSSSARSLGVGRFYSPPHRRQQELLQQELLQQQEKPQRPVKTRQKPGGPPELEAREVESRVDSDDSSSKPSMSASPSPPPTPPPPAGNLDRFLQSTTPVVPALYPTKV